MKGRYKNIAGMFGVCRRVQEFLFRILFLFALFLSATSSGNALAQNIFIVPSKLDGPHLQVANGLKAKLDSGLVGEHTIIIVNPGEGAPLKIDATREDYIVTVGSKAFSFVLSLNPDAKILATLIPGEAYRVLLKKYARKPGTTSAVYIEQPVIRSLNLVKAALPGRTPGVLVGSQATGLYEQIRKSSNAINAHVYLKQLRKKENLVSALDQVLKNCGVFVAFVDPEVSNASTARHLLLASYRYGIPVVAYSQAYVRAGALMAVYTTPEQFAQQAAQLLIRNIRTKAPKLPLPVYPEYFSIDVNENVARSMGIRLQKKSVLESRLKSLESIGNE